MRMRRFAATGLALVAALVLAAPTFAQGVGGGVAGTGWTIGKTDLSFRRTGAVATFGDFRQATGTGGIGSVGGGFFLNSSGTKLGSFRDSSAFNVNAAAGVMQFDTTTSFSLSSLKGWMAAKQTSTNVAADSIWIFSLEVAPVMDVGLPSLVTTSNSLTIAADTLNIYAETSWNGGLNWSRLRAGAIPVSYLAQVPSPTAAAMPYFHVAFNSVIPNQNASTITSANFFQNDALYRFVVISDWAGAYHAWLTYPRAIR